MSDSFERERERKNVRQRWKKLVCTRSSVSSHIEKRGRGRRKRGGRKWEGYRKILIFSTEKYKKNHRQTFLSLSQKVSLSSQLYFSFPLFFKIDLKLDVISIKLIENLWCVFVPPPLTHKTYEQRRRKRLREWERGKERNPTYQKAWSLNDRYSFIQGKHFMQHTHSQTKEIGREIGRRERNIEKSQKFQARTHQTMQSVIMQFYSESRIQFLSFFLFFPWISFIFYTYESKRTRYI